MSQRTALYDVHAEAGATFTEFAGYEMPVHYGSIKEEHAAVREAVGLFDVSHMSNLFFDDVEAMSRLTPKSMDDLEVGRGRYSVLLREDGTILDDVFLFRLEDGYMLVPNAGRNEAATAALKEQGATVRDESAQWSIFALQGPTAREVLAAASSDEAPKFHRITAMQIAGADCLVSGTGYTGEKGVEVYCKNEDAPTVWAAIMAAGKAHGIRPIGLGARDTLRLEKGYALAGNEFAQGRTPLEASLDWLVDWDHAFVGKDALVRQRDQDHDRLVGLTLEKGIPRAGYTVMQAGENIGVITSGTLSPTLGYGIALAYCRAVGPEDEVTVDVRGRALAARVAAPPFV